MKAGLRGAALAMAIAAAAVAADAAASGAGRGSDPGTRAEAQETLTSLINRQIRAEGSFFTPAEQQVIAAKCGYRPGEWDGYDVSMSNGVFRCANGRRVDDPEMRAVMEAASPRIERRVKAVMASREVREAIDRVARLATAEALRSIEEKRSR